MSPALLSKRLKELEQAGVVTTTRKTGGLVEYRLSEAGEELRPLIIGLGSWAQRWMESRLSLRNLDPSLLMWDMRRCLDAGQLPARRCTIQFLYPELTAAQKSWWLVVEDGKVDLCNFDPGYELDLQVRSSLKSMKFLPEQSAHVSCEEISVRRTNRTLEADPAAGARVRRRPASAGANAWSPLPSKAIVKFTPSDEVSTVNCRVVADESSRLKAICPEAATRLTWIL